MERRRLEEVQRQLEGEDFGGRDLELQNRISMRRMLTVGGWVHLLEKYEERGMLCLRVVSFCLLKSERVKTQEIKLLSAPEQEFVLPAKQFGDHSVEIQLHPSGQLVTLTLISPTVLQDLVFVSILDTPPLMSTLFYRIVVASRIIKVRTCKRWGHHLVVLTSDDTLKVYDVWNNLMEPRVEINFKELGINRATNVNILEREHQWVGIVVLGESRRIFLLQLGTHDFKLSTHVELSLHSEITQQIQNIEIISYEEQLYFILSSATKTTDHIYITTLNTTIHSLSLLSKIPLPVPPILHPSNLCTFTLFYQTSHPYTSIFALSSNKIISLTFKHHGDMTEIVPNIHMEIDSFQEMACVGVVNSQLIVVYRKEGICVRMFSLMDLVLSSRVECQELWKNEEDEDIKQLDSLKKKIMSRLSKVEKESQLVDALEEFNPILQKKVLLLLSLVQENQKLKAENSSHCEWSVQWQEMYERLQYLQQGEGVCSINECPIQRFRPQAIQQFQGLLQSTAIEQERKDLLQGALSRIQYLSSRAFE